MRDRQSRLNRTPDQRLGEGDGRRPPAPAPTQDPDASVRPVDGIGSNADQPDWGAAGQVLQRLADAWYEDGIGQTVDDLPNARGISNAVVQQTEDEPSSFGFSDMFWVWGQFVDHDIDLTGSGVTEYTPVSVPAGDPYFDSDGTGEAVIPFFRTDYVAGSGETTPRDYVNEITAFIDASMVYGSDAETNAALRAEGGKLIVTEENLLVETGNGDVLAGDIRAGENVGLTAMQTLFAREHNRWVDELAAADPNLDDDALYAAARQRVEAEIQAITFNEFLPLLVGEDAIAAYQGYDPTINPGISIEFATAAYRFGHSLVSSEIQRLEEDGSVIAAGNLPLGDAFFAPEEISGNGGIDPVLRGLADGTAQQIDTHIVEDLRSLLFGEPGDGGLDLAVLNIERGRDLGVAGYNDLREAMGLQRAANFSDITSDAALAAALQEVYGDVDLVEAWIGGLAEDPYGDGAIGELFSMVIIDQFSRLRDGDPFWSEGSGIPQDELDALWETTLADVIEGNSDIGSIQDNALLAYDRIGGTDGDDGLTGTEGRDLILGFDGNDRLAGRAGDDQLEGGAGRDRLSGERGDDMLYGDDGRDRLAGGRGEDRLNGGGGDDVLTGGRDGDVFIFEGAFGNDTITDFRDGRGRGDIIQLENGFFVQAGDIVDAAVQRGDDTVIDFGDDGSITLENFNVAELDESDFVIA
jgi:Ca2+-binding RTX toxin-like protein